MSEKKVSVHNMVVVTVFSVVTVIRVVTMIRVVTVIRVLTMIRVLILMSEEMIKYRVQAFQLQEVEENLENEEI